MLGGLFLMITALTWSAAFGQVRNARVEPSHGLAPAPGEMAGQVENALSRADGQSRVRPPEGASTQSGVIRAAMDPWAGPVSQDERRLAPRKLSSEERVLLRQEIRRASEEVYEPYRKQKH